MLLIETFLGILIGGLGLTLFLTLDFWVLQGYIRLAGEDLFGTLPFLLSNLTLFNYLRA